MIQIGQHISSDVGGMSCWVCHMIRVGGRAIGCADGCRRDFVGWFHCKYQVLEPGAWGDGVGCWGSMVFEVSWLSGGARGHGVMLVLEVMV